MVKKGQIVKFKKDFMDDGDEEIIFIANEDESNGRVLIKALLNLPLNPTQIVHTFMLDLN